MCLGLEENGNGLEEPNEKAKNKNSNELKTQAHTIEEFQ